MELDQHKNEIDQHKKEIDQNKIELDLMIAELAQEKHLRQVAEHNLLQYERGQPTSFQGSGGAVPTIHRPLPVVSESSIMRTGSTQGSAYQREGSDSLATTDTMRPLTNIKAGPFPDSITSALTEQAFSSLSSSFLEPPPSPVAVACRRLAATTVTTYAELTAAFVNDATIELATNILLGSTVWINGLTGVAVDGKGFEVDGQNNARCFYFYNGAEVALTDLTITRGFSATVSRRVRTPLYFLLLRFFHVFFSETLLQVHLFLA
jgi:hypothetical protein